MKAGRRAPGESVEETDSGWDFKTCNDEERGPRGDGEQRGGK